MTEPSQWINAVEQDLRGLIESVLSAAHGANWLSRTGLSAERLEALKERRAEETKRRPGGRVEQNLIAYSQFFELRTIIDKNWVLFKDALGDKKRFGVYFDRLDQFRNPPAHSRELLPFERDLLAGMAGEIRNRVTIYRSEMGPSREYYPRIEWVRDSFGNSSASEDARMQDVFTKVRLAIGQQVTFQCRGWDPQGRDLNWRLEEQGIGRPRLDTATGTDVTLSFTAAREHVGDSLSVAIVLVGSGEYHRYGPGSYDGVAAFHYAVSPPTDLT